LLEFLGPIQHNAHYATGMRRSELAHLKVSDHDSQRMIIRVVEGKGGKDRDLPLSRTLLETLREYWRWRKPRLYLFPTRTCRHKLDQPISDKTVWIACSDAARRAGIRKRQRLPPSLFIENASVRNPCSTQRSAPRRFRSRLATIHSESPDALPH
jgi:integrase